MQLYEEYLRRNEIEDRRIVKHVDQATVFYKSDNGRRQTMTFRKAKMLGLE